MANRRNSSDSSINAKENSESLISEHKQKDQYENGKAAKSWTKYVGCSTQRTNQYREGLRGILLENDCQTVLDAACGTG